MRLLCFVTLSAGLPQFVLGQTIVESTFLPLQSSGYAPWSKPTNWSPAEVPNDTATRVYNVTLSDHQYATVDINPTIQNLAATGRSGLSLSGHSLNVVGQSRFELPVIAVSAGTFKSGGFSTGTANALSGYFNLLSYSGAPALVQFNGAHVTTLQNASLTLVGSGAGFVDENGSDALRDLARIDAQSTLHLDDHPLVVSPAIDVAGMIELTGDTTRPTTFTASAGLANFDAATRTLAGGTFIFHGLDGSQAPPVELRFAGADIVNNASHIQLDSEMSRFADLNGIDGMRNFARNTPEGRLTLNYRTFVVPRDFTNDGALILNQSTFIVLGALTNFDAASRTVRGGSFTLDGSKSSMRFASADVVHNGAVVSLANGAAITDASGNDAFRNLTDNLASGTFVVGVAQVFNAPGSFSNAGRVEVQPAPEGGIPESTPPPEGQFTLPTGTSYTQSAGASTIDGRLTAGTIDIRGGTLSGTGTINGNVNVGDATVYPGGIINGSLTLSATTRVHCFLDRYSTFTQWKGISGNVALAGNLEVEIRYENYVASTVSFTVLAAKQVSGQFSNAPDGARIATTDGRGSFVVHYDGRSVKLSNFAANPPPARLLNISTRGFLKGAQNDTFGDSVLTGGFIILGTETKRVVVRGLGPSLAAFGVPSPVQDTRIDLYDANRQMIASNDNWRDTPEGDLTKNGLAPSDYREAALVADLAPGAYTVALRDVTGVGGGALVEVYDLTRTDTSKLANISSRGFLDRNDPLIGGIIAREGQGNAELVVRAIGPQLRRNGVFDAVEDPTLELRDANGALVAANDDWGTNFDQIINELRPFNATEAAMHVSVPAGSYTAIVRGKGAGAGQALVEFYDLRR